MNKPAVDRTFAVAWTATVVDDPVAAVRTCYNAVAQAFKAAGREPAMVEVRVYAKPKEPSNG